MNNFLNWIFYFFHSDVMLVFHALLFFRAFVWFLVNFFRFSLFAFDSWLWISCIDYDRQGFCQGGKFLKLCIFKIRACLVISLNRCIFLFGFLLNNMAQIGFVLLWIFVDGFWLNWLIALTFAFLILGVWNFWFKWFKFLWMYLLLVFKFLFDFFILGLNFSVFLCQNNSFFILL